MAFRLPPLSSLRLFEAAARHVSFRDAAVELNITASAVSHGIQTLEAWLGVELFHRDPKKLRLTLAGEAYAPFVSEALGVLAQATERIPGRKASGTLSISSAPTFASRIVLPRLDRFSLQFPDIRVTLDTSQRLVNLTHDNFDAAIRFAPVKPQSANWTMLTEETLVPLCSPRLRDRFADIADEQVLAQAQLIHVTSVLTDWAYWFQTNGIDPPASIEKGLRVDTMLMAFEAARRGVGIVLGRRPLVDEELASGQLVQLGSQTVPSGSAYWLVISPSEFQKPEVKLFRQWLLNELASLREPPKRTRPSLRAV